jgi:cobalt/nickel transport system ATP-binding protein
VAVAILEAKQLRFAYGRSPWAVDGVSLQVLPGSRVALLGANGAGKTTLLHLFVGLNVACEGHLALNGAQVPANRAGALALRRAAGLVLQDPDDQLFAATVMADVIIGPLNAGQPEPEAERRAAAALASMGITDLAHRRVATLSLGEKKRVAIAGVLAMEPQVLLLDEPTAGLDHHGAQALVRALDARVAEGMAVILATHNTDLALEWAAETIVLERGRPLAHGTPGTILQDAEFCHRAGLRQPVLLEAARRVSRRLGLAALEGPITNAEQLAERLEEALVVRKGAAQ